jgi:hypothetical protein
MTYLPYKFNYRYICNLCNISLELKTQSPITKNQEPKCICGNIIALASYFGPNGVPMYNGIIE